MRNLLTILAILSLATTLNAQQLPVFNQYYLNQYINSPSKAGTSDDIRAFLHYRRQWVGIPGAPESSMITVDGPVDKRNFGLGLMMTNDRTNILGRTSVFVTYNYKIKLTETQNLSMAVSPGFVQNNVYFDKIRAEYSDEPTILENSEARTAFDVNAGLTYSFKKFETSFSVFQLSENKFNYENQFDFKDLTFRLIRHYYLTSKYTFHLKHNIELSPIVNFRSVQGITPQYDIYAAAKWKGTFWGAIGYRGNYGVSFSIGGFVLDNLNFSYSYDLAVGNIALLSGGSHELSIGYVFGEREKKFEEPVYSNLNDYQDVPYQKVEQYEIVQQENDGLKEQLNNNKKELIKQKEEIERLKDLLEQNKANLDEIMKKFMINIEDDLPAEANNELEEKGYHVIVGAYYKLDDAKFFQKILQRELSLETRVYEREDGKYFFVYTTTVNDKNDLNKEVKRLKKMNINEYINGNVWIAE